MDRDTHVRGRAFAEAVRGEIERFALGDRLAVDYVPEGGVVRLSICAAEGQRRQELSYPPTLDAVHRIVGYLRTESRLVGMQRQRDEARRRALERAADERTRGSGPVGGR